MNHPSTPKAFVQRRLIEWSLLFAWALLSCCLPLQADDEDDEDDEDRGNQMTEEFADSVFPRQMGLENRWENLRSRATAVSQRTLNQLFEESATGNGVVPWTIGRRTDPTNAVHTAIWLELDRFLLAQPPSDVAGIRQEHDREAAGLGDSPDELDPCALTIAFRRLPWATVIHEALLSSGERALRNGHSSVALRAFRDVLNHAADEGLRRKAQAGVWLALAGEGADLTAIEAAFRDVPPDTPFPWLDGSRSASAIKASLVTRREPALMETNPPSRANALSATSDPSEGNRELAKRPFLLLRTPPYSPWNYRGWLRYRDEALRLFPPAAGQLQTDRGFTLLSGPNLLVGYGSDPRQPLWARIPGDISSPEKRARGDRPAMPIPGSFRPAITQTAVLARWGLDAGQQYLTGLAAFHRDTGEVLWSTQGDPDWKDMWPASDPTVAEGVVYVLGLREGETAISPIWLVCLDPHTGRTRWKRILASCDVGLERGEGSPHLSKRQIDLAHYGNAVTVRRGGVFCISQLGFVARCDPRDGLVDWIHSYPRVPLGTNLHEVMQRQGAAPAVCGNVIICLPRDAVGIFALDVHTGELQWENNRVRARSLVGVCRELVILRNERELVALNASTGEPVWQREFADGLIGQPQLAGTTLYAGTREHLVSLDALTGETSGEQEWEGAEPVRQFAAAANGIFLLRDDSASASLPTAPDRARPLEPRRSENVLALPVTETWQLRSDHPALWIPPARTALTNLLFCYADGVLHALRTGADIEVAWHRLLQSGFERPAWSRHCLLLPAGRSLLAVNAVTGAAVWEATLPFEVVELQVCDDLLFVGNLRKDGAAAALRGNTGEVVWQQALPFTVPGERREENVWFTWDGRHLHLLVRSLRAGGELKDYVVNMQDASVVATHPIFKGPPARHFRVALGSRVAYLCTESGETFEYSLTNGQLTPHLKMPNAGREDAIHSVALAEPWVLASTRGRSGRDNARELHVRKVGDPALALAVTTTGRGEIRGDTLLVFQDDDRLVRAIDLPGGKEVRWQAPRPPERPERGQVLDCRLDTHTVWMVSGDGRYGDRNRAGMRLDRFDRATGTHLGGQLLRDLGLWQAQGEDDDEEWWSRPRPIAWTDRFLVCADNRALHAFAAAPPGGTVGRSLRVAHRAETPVSVDGRLEEWAGHAGFALRSQASQISPSAPRARIHLAHDESRLFVAVRCADAFALGGSGSLSAGDHLELGLRGERGCLEAMVSPDAQQRVHWEMLEGLLPSGAQAAVYHDAIRRELNYELALPLRSLVGDGDEARKLELAVSVCDDRPGNIGPLPRFSWGGDLDNHAARSDYEAVYLDPITPTGTRAAQAIIAALPDLPESMQLLTEWWTARREIPESLLAFTRELLRKYPRHLAAERLLLLLDGALRTRLEDDPTARVLALADEAGVPEAVQQRYRRQSHTYLSQWVLSRNDDLPRSILLGLNDGSRPDGYAHHLGYWIKGAGRWKTPPIHLGGGDDIPRGQWHELRVPLFMLQMHERPIRGILFFQQGGPPLIWDRTAVVSDGRENVFIDDAVPPGTLEGPWEWITDPVKSGVRAHTQSGPDQRYNLASHAVENFVEPVTSHLVFPEDRPYLSQWIWLDPTNPPQSVVIGLYHESGQKCAATWGRSVGQGRYMGPLPPAGQWTELRVPLPWTGFDTLPIQTLGFGQAGGQAVWDRTSVVMDGREQVLIEDDAPALRTDRRRREWQPWHTNRIGTTWAVPGRIGDALYCDGRTGYVEIPHAPELDPTQLTVEAWVRLEVYPLGGENRRWIVNKNFHESTEGHWGLVIRGRKAGVYLNIGDSDGGRYEGWSEDGSIQLRHWHHLAMTYDSANLKFYLDGQVITNVPVNKVRIPRDYPIHLGRRQDGYVYADCAIDEVRIYDRALSPGEMKASFESPGSAGADAQTAHWGFDGQAAATNPATDWRWTTTPVKSGTRARRQVAKPEGSIHFAPLRDPVIGHLPFSLDSAMAVLKTHIPDLGPTDHAYGFLNGLIRLTGSEPTNKIGAYEWFARGLPDHPRTPEALGRLMQEYERAGQSDARQAVNDFFVTAGISPATYYQYNRRYAYPYRPLIRAWQLLAPFANEGGKGWDTPCGPELDGVDLARKYPGVFEEVGWQRHESQWDFIDLGSVFGGHDHAVAYAACWVHSDRDAAAALVAGSDEACKVWVNRTLALQATNTTAARVSQDIVPIQLKQGWNEVLVKLGQGSGHWGFELEIIDAQLSRASADFRASPVAPR